MPKVGPGQYDPSNKVVKESSPKYGIGSSDRID